MRLFIFLQLCSVLFIFGCEPKEQIVVDNLCCENLVDPLGIDTTVPRFSWKISSSRKGAEQKAFQVMVSSDMGELENNNADMWDSGKTESSASIWVAYEGKPLKPGIAAYWKVRVWDNAGNVSPWSQVAEFSIGLLSKTNWRASYIGFPSKAGDSECPQFKKSFNFDKDGKKILLHVNSLGYHEVYLNGEKVGESVLSPAVSQFDKRSLVVTYDVSSSLKEGTNELMFWLGSGWYSDGYPGVTNAGPVVKAQLEQISDSKREIVLVTDSTWGGRSSEYTRIGRWRSGRYGGECFSSENTTNAWLPVSEVSIPDHNVSPQMVEQNKITKTINPVEIKQLIEKIYLVDMGKNLTGWFEISFPKLQKSQEITLEYCDHLDENGQFVNQKQVDKYVASGEGQEMFKNKFNYHGFRYVRISNLNQAPDINSIKAHLIHSDFELASGFQCSDPEINRIHDLLFYTLRCLSLGGYLVDCPHLERLGYGGDGNASTLTAQTMFGLYPLYCNWLQAWGDCMRPNGDLPHTAPSPIDAGGGPYWGGFIINAPWNTYLNYGDVSVLEKYYPLMNKWLGFVEDNMVNGLLKKWEDTAYRGWYLGDWASPEGVDQTAEASVDVVNNCFIAVCYDQMQDIAKLLGEEVQADLFAQKSKHLKNKIHQTFFEASQNTYATGSQIDLTYPLLADVVPEDLIDSVTASLVNSIKQKYNGHFACGLVGIPVFTEWVTKSRKADLMYSMLKKKAYPGYLYMLDNGATTTWEHWNGERSRIHNCYNGIGSWFYQALGGIRQADGSSAYRKVIIQPQIPEGITWAKTWQETPYGKLLVSWEFVNNKLEMEVEIPVGVDAEVLIPNGIGEYTLDGNKYDVKTSRDSVVGIGSGKYRITYTAI
ncbi:family 78 glycoside hydrolase catalytic domain [Maribellus sp. CM-23]|uniref:alpha-L-rhamnosidase n=1 Tax=Maribellus sp. CM-23 TaxID=2781026 RepID=UPI001F3C7473|nr:alpha-L-rhamnosidase [Maribellus sp. CM-23]MCE4565887.1 family 78 glycoside hydrolase catalytic domain [Maribellus sp. CM-23]